MSTHVISPDFCPKGAMIFEESVALYRDGATATATSNSSTAYLTLTNDRRLHWESSGSDDTTTETITVTLPSATAISSIFLFGHNFKEYNLTGNSGAVNFENAVGINGEVPRLVEQVTNGTFTAWTADDPDNWSVATESAGNYEVTEVANGARFFTNGTYFEVGQDSVFTVGKKYEITLVISNFSGFGIAVNERAGALLGTPTLIGNITSNGTWTFTLNSAAKPALNIARLFGGATDLVIESVSVREIPATISEDDYSRTTSYYSFDEVTVTTIEINCTKTQTVDAEKQLTSFLATELLGQYQFYPNVTSVAIDRNEKSSKVLSEKQLVQKGFKTRRFDLNLAKYLTQADVTLTELLHDKEENFYVWLCGSLEGTTYFKPSMQPFELDDLITMQTIGNINNRYPNNYYKGGVNTTLKLREVVG